MSKLGNLLTPGETAKALGLSVKTLATWRSTGREKLPFVKVGSLVRYRVEDVEAWLQGAPNHRQPRPLKQATEQALHANAAWQRTQTAGVPEGWKLVPFHPTPDMIRAAEEAHMPCGDMDIALRMAILAAAPVPTQQAEPATAQDEREARAWPDVAGIGRDSEHPRAVVLYLRHEPSDEHLRTIQEALRTRPAQPAVGEEIMVNAAHDVYTLPLQPSGLDGSGPRFVVHVPARPAPDVSALVEALELARRTLAMAAIEGEVTRRIDSALAAHRKQGGGA